MVRDEILGAESFDTDFCYEGNAVEFAKSKGLNIIKENPDFGTVRVLYEGKEIDIASTREEDYPKKGHLPVVKNIGCSLKKDLKRRDFTINAMAKNTVTNEIYDPFGGLTDIQNKNLRILHNNSFIDDPTRILRGLKFGVRFGFELDENTKMLQEEYLNHINYDMSYHRIKKELTETFNLNKAEAFNLFIEREIYKLLGETIIPIYVDGGRIQAVATEFDPNDSWIFYLSFFNPLETNIQFTRREKRIFEWTNRLLNGENVTNNTPAESAAIYKLMTEKKC